jgi:hypothetical protein
MTSCTIASDIFLDQELNQFWVLPRFQSSPHLDVDGVIGRSDWWNENFPQI